MIKKIFIYLFAFIFTVFYNTAFWSGETNISIDLNSTFITGDKSIKELKNWLIELTKNQNELNLEFFVLNQNQKLKEFFREDLLKKEISVIENIIKKY